MRSTRETCQPGGGAHGFSSVQSPLCSLCQPVACPLFPGSTSFLCFGLGCSEAWFPHFLPQAFSVMVPFAPTGPPQGLSLFFSQRELSVLKALFRKAGRGLLFF